MRKLPGYLNVVLRDEAAVRSDTREKRPAPEAETSSKRALSKRSKSAKNIPAQETRRAFASAAEEAALNSPPSVPTALTTNQLVTQTLPPPPPIQLSQSIIWNDGVNKELLIGLRPPQHYFEPSRLTEAEIKELKDIEHLALKASALSQVVGALKNKYANTHKKLELVTTEKNKAREKVNKVLDELRVAKAEKEKTYEELVKTKEELQKTKSDLFRELQTHEKDLNVLNMVKAMHEKLEMRLKDREEALKAAQADISELKNGAEESFNNALEQIQLLNPSVDLNTSGANYKAYVDDGKLIPPPPSLVGGSISLLEGDQDEERGEEANVPHPAGMEVRSNTDPDAAAPPC